VAAPTCEHAAEVQFGVECEADTGSGHVGGAGLQKGLVRALLRGGLIQKSVVLTDTGRSLLFLSPNKVTNAIPGDDLSIDGLRCLVACEERS
jgi:hypothetical protein